MFSYTINSNCNPISRRISRLNYLKPKKLSINCLLTKLHFTRDVKSVSPLHKTARSARIVGAAHFHPRCIQRWRDEMRHLERGLVVSRRWCIDDAGRKCQLAFCEGEECEFVGHLNGSRQIWLVGGQENSVPWTCKQVWGRNTQFRKKYLL